MRWHDMAYSQLIVEARPLTCHVPMQLALIEALQRLGKSLVVITIHGGPVAETALATSERTAWLWVSYFGQDGRGVADVLFGDTPPSGALPFTVPASVRQLGDIADYSMRALPFGKTYRYLDLGNTSASPLFHFGHQLTYEPVTYDAMVLQTNTSCPAGAAVGTTCAAYHDTLHVTVVVTNAGHGAAIKIVAVFGEFLSQDGAVSEGTIAAKTQRNRRSM